MHSSRALRSRIATHFSSSESELLVVHQWLRTRWFISGLECSYARGFVVAEALCLHGCYLHLQYLPLPRPRRAARGRKPWADSPAVNTLTFSLSHHVEFGLRCMIPLQNIRHDWQLGPCIRVSGRMQICFPTAQTPMRSDAAGARQPLVYPECVRIILVQWGRTINLHAPGFLFYLYIYLFFFASWANKVILLVCNTSAILFPWINNMWALFVVEKQRERIVNAINTFL